ncbi:MAG: phosphoribosylglycinamide formyltransferase [Candidatus Woesearchaeota archaeon]|nr:phosphoribosylglycinamide formyltransferase [Candidatus Woesearchaeota archaeon]
MGSTRGTDLQAVIDSIENGKLNDVKISVVISNKEGAFILERAKQYDIKAMFIDPKGKSKEEYDEKIMKVLEKESIDLVLLIGYMKLMSTEFVGKWKNKVMNIHPSLLPMFAGGMDRDVHQDVLDRGAKVSGCTLIFIDEGADTGPVILQKSVDVSNGETVDSLREKVQEAEQEIIIKGIELFRDGKLEIVGRKVKILE